MQYFSELPDAQAIVFSGGVYRQVKLCERGGKLYAAHGTGWIRLLGSSITSHPKVRWYEAEVEGREVVETASGVVLK